MTYAWTTSPPPQSCQTQSTSINAFLLGTLLGLVGCLPHMIIAGPVELTRNTIGLCLMLICV